MSSFRYGVGYDWDEHHVIKPMLILFLRGGSAPKVEIPQHENCVERGLMEVDLFDDVHLTKQGETVLDEYHAWTSRFTWHD